MSESASYSSRFRPRAQSLFEYRPRTNTELTIALLDRLISTREIYQMLRIYLLARPMVVRSLFEVVRNVHYFLSFNPLSPDLSFSRC